MSPAASSAWTRSRPDAASRRAEERGRRRFEGEGPTFCICGGACSIGLADGPNLRMEIRWGGGNVNRASVFAKELVALQPDVILAQGTPVTAALKRETRTIPIVFATVLAKRRAETYDCVETC